MSNIAKELIATQQRLESDKGTYNSHCQEVARYVIPRLDEFFSNNRTAGEKRSQYQFDSTAPLALDRFSAIISSLVTPRGQYWHGLSPEDDELSNNHEAMIWYEAVRNKLFKLRYGSGSNFANQIGECYQSMGAFGTGVLIVEERAAKWARYKSSHIKEHHFMENEDGVIDTNYRKYQLTAKQAAEKFGTGALSGTINNALEKTPEMKFDFLHVVMPNYDRKPQMIDNNGMAYKSYHVDLSGNSLCAKEGGFRKFPFIPLRYITSTNEIYGRSPAMTALAEIKMLNQMRKTDIKARHLAVDAPILASNEASVRKVSLKPNAISYGTLDMNGNPLVRPWQTGNNLSASEKGIEDSRRIINDIFLVNLFQILLETPEMTATEVLQRQQEKGDLLSPIGGSLESESFNRLIERELDMMAHSGMFDDDGELPMPKSVKDAGGAYTVEFTSPLARMRMAGEAAGAERTLQALIPAAQVDPTVLDAIDFDAYAQIMKKANGAPERMMKAPEVIKAIREQRNQQQAMAQMAQAAPQVAGAVKDIAQAQALQ